MINEDVILKFLKDDSKKRGGNYSFKCKYIAKRMKTNTYIISRHIRQLKKQGIIKIKDKASSGIIYETCFEEDEK